MASQLVLHAGGVRVERSALALVETPPPTETWFPTPHDVVANEIISQLNLGGFEVAREQWALAGKEGERMFGVLDLRSSIQGSDETLAVGIRNSVDKSFALGFCAGSRTFVCDNLAFNAELVVKRKHTQNGYRNFSAKISQAVTALEPYIVTQRERLVRWQDTKMDTKLRDHLLLSAFESNMFPRRMLPAVFREQVRPQYAEFSNGSVYAFFSNFTTALRERSVKHLAEYSFLTNKLTMEIEAAIFGLTPPTPAIDVNAVLKPLAQLESESNQNEGDDE